MYTCLLRATNSIQPINSNAAITPIVYLSKGKVLSYNISHGFFQVCLGLL
jgi:hypothetical protein